MLINKCIMQFIITPTYAQISSIKLILKLLQHVSVLIHHLQGVYKLCNFNINFILITCAYVGTIININ